MGGKGFAFDHVFTEESSQADVFEEVVRPVVGKLFEGFNSAVIAYGHTGTGKTYTIGTDPKVNCLYIYIYIYKGWVLSQLSFARLVDHEET